MYQKILFFTFLFANNAMAQDAAPAAPGGIASFLPLVAVLVIFYFLLIRPQAKQAKAHTAMVNSLKQNDKVIAASGIYGKVVKVNEAEKTVDVEIAENVVVTMNKASVSELVNKIKKPANDDGVKKLKKSPVKKLK